MTNNFILNLDKLEVCYTATPETIEELRDTKYREYEGFRIFSIDSDNSTKESFLQIDIKHPDTDGSLVWLKFGTLKVGSVFDVEEDSPRYVWLRLDNRILYTPMYPDTSIACYIYPISESLLLSYNNITKIDVAVDSNVNYFSRIKKAVRNMELVPIVLGSAYPEKKVIIDKLLYIHTADRERYRTNSISISSSEKDFSLAVYNKSEEIGESHKDYIAEWNGSLRTIYRAEVRLKRSALRDYLEAKGVTFEDLYYKLFNKELLFSLFCFYSDKLLRFRSGRDTVSILQL